MNEVFNQSTVTFVSVLQFILHEPLNLIGRALADNQNHWVITIIIIIIIIITKVLCVYSIAVHTCP